MIVAMDAYSIVPGGDTFEQQTSPFGLYSLCYSHIWVLTEKRLVVDWFAIQPYARCDEIGRSCWVECLVNYFNDWCCPVHFNSLPMCLPDLWLHDVQELYCSCFVTALQLLWVSVQQSSVARSTALPYMYTYVPYISYVPSTAVSYIHQTHEYRLYVCALTTFHSVARKESLQVVTALFHTRWNDAG